MEKDKFWCNAIAKEIVEYKMVLIESAQRVPYVEEGREKER